MKNKERLCGIYKITNKLNSKVYIGKSINIYSRWSDHKRAAFKESADTYNRPLYKAFRAHGLENFTFEIIEQCSRQDLTHREQFWITSLNCSWPNGYNIADTAWYNSFEKLTIDLVKIILTDLTQTSLSIKQVAKKYNLAYNLVSDLNRGRIAKYRLDGFNYPILSTIEIIKRNTLIDKKDSLNKYTFLDYWSAIKESLELNTLANTCEKFKTSPTSLRRWLAYYKLPPLATFLSQSFKCSPVYQLTLAGEIINRFESLHDAAESVFKSSNYAGVIGNVCNHKKATAGGYQWCFVKDFSRIKPIINAGNRKKVCCKELNITFSSLAEAAKFVNGSVDNISDCCNGRRKKGVAYGYHWSFII